MERLDKTIANFGNMPRSQATRLIRIGQVRVNGAVCRDPSYKFQPDTAEVTVGGRPLDCRAHRYVMLNKPQGILCVSRDPHAETVVDLLPPDLRRKGMFPAGRLDKDTVGLVLLTDDGDWAHRVLSPKKAVFKQYRAVVSGRVDERLVATFAEGTTLTDGTRCLPAVLRLLSPEAFAAAESDAALVNDKIPEFLRTFSAKYRIPEAGEITFVEIAIQEGRYHQIKRMFEAANHKVLWLKRFSMGALFLDETLIEGQSRELTPDESAAVFEEVEGLCAK